MEKTACCRHRRLGAAFFFNLDFSGSNSDEEECEDIIRFSGPPLAKRFNVESGGFLG